MLLRLLVIVPVYCCVGVILDGTSEILLDDEFTPDLHDLLVEVLGIDDLALLLKDLTHVVIRTA